MSQSQPKAVKDGFLSAERGVDSGRSPVLLPSNQFSFAVNTTFRGGFPTNRPGFKKVDLSFPDNNSFQGNRFQGAFVYSPDAGTAFLTAMIGGRLYQVTVDGVVKDISAPDANPSNRPLAYFEQAENFLISQDGQTKALIFNGASSRRADNDEVPVGTAMGYVNGRLSVAVVGGQYVVGDIVNGPSGTAKNGFRDAVLKFTENEFLSEGGAFSLPVRSGDISAMSPTANINTATGQGSLVVSSRKTVCTSTLPADRTIWKSLTNPIQTIAQLSFGIQGPRQLATVNGDVWYRSKDGYRSLIIAVRNFDVGWGNTPMSKEMNRILKQDDKRLLKYGSMVCFDNRLLGTVSPVQTEYGVYHRGLAVLDFDLISSMGGRGISDTLNPPNPAWEGVWTGLNVLQVLVGEFNEVERCFVFALNSSNQIELWELTAGDDFDNGDTRIDWWQELPSYRFGDGFNLKELQHGELSYDRLKGEVDFAVSYRPDQYPFWKDWQSWTECATYKDCPPAACEQPGNYGEQYRPKKALMQPSDDFVPGINRLFRHGYEFQMRIEVTGCARLKQCRFVAHDIPESPLGELPDSIPCQGLTGCDESIFTYDIEASAPVPPTGKQDQSITFNPIGDLRANSGPIDMTPYVSASSGLAVTFSILSGPASVVGSMITIAGNIGDIVIQASQAGDGDFNAAQNVTQTIHVYDVGAVLRIRNYEDGFVGACASCPVQSTDTPWDGSFAVFALNSWFSTNPDEFTFSMNGKEFHSATITLDVGNVYGLRIYCTDPAGPDGGDKRLVWYGTGGPAVFQDPTLYIFYLHPESCATGPSTLNFGERIIVNDAPIKFVPTTIPAGVCFASEQERYNYFASHLSGFLPGSFTAWNIGSSEPAANDRDKPWLRLNADGSLDRPYYFFAGKWLAPHQWAPNAGVIVMWEGVLAAIDTFDGGDSSAITDTNRPDVVGGQRIGRKIPARGRHVAEWIGCGCGRQWW
jgi:hypothetical protein